MIDRHGQGLAAGLDDGQASDHFTEGGVAAVTVDDQDAGKAVVRQALCHV
jgi:hypothetical protein